MSGGAGNCMTRFMVGLLLLTAASAANAQEADQTYCTFRPQADSCQPVYQKSLGDSAPGALSVRNAFAAYGRYVRAAKTSNASLTDEDRRILAANNITLPTDLNAEDLAGLHEVIRGQSGQNAAAAQAINSYLSHAIQAELYCDFNACGT
jgi:hypothetical protein